MLVGFVCSGNICRSPMAEAFARAEAGGHLDCAGAGIEAVPGSMATPQARLVMAEVGSPIDGHEASTLASLIARRPDLIYVMTERHRTAVEAALGGLRCKVELLRPDGADIADPYGHGLEVYRTTRDRIREAVRLRAPAWR